MKTINHSHIYMPWQILTIGDVSGADQKLYKLGRLPMDPWMFTSLHNRFETQSVQLDCAISKIRSPALSWRSIHIACPRQSPLECFLSLPQNQPLDVHRNPAAWQVPTGTRTTSTTTHGVRGWRRTAAKDAARWRAGAQRRGARRAAGTGGAKDVTFQGNEKRREIEMQKGPELGGVGDGIVFYDPASFWSRWDAIYGFCRCV